MYLDIIRVKNIKIIIVNNIKYFLKIIIKNHLNYLLI